MHNLLAEAIGTMILVLLGDGVVANVVLGKTKGQNSGWIVITTGGASRWRSPSTPSAHQRRHLNPAVTIALPSAASRGTTCPAIAAQMLGAFLGAVLVWLAYLPHWRVTADPGSKLRILSTRPAIRNTAANCITGSSAPRSSCSAFSRSPRTRKRSQAGRRRPLVRVQPRPAAAARRRADLRHRALARRAGELCPQSRAIWGPRIARDPADPRQGIVRGMAGFPSSPRSSAASPAPASIRSSVSEERDGPYVGAVDQGTTARASWCSTREATGSPAADRAPADPAAARVGRARSAGDRGAHRRGDRARDAQRQSHRRRSRGHRRHQPARNHHRLEPEDRPSLVRHRLAGHAHRSDRQCALRGAGTADPIAHGLLHATYFSGAKIQWILENVPGVREAAARKASGLRQSRHLGDLEPDRRQDQHPRDRRHQRRPDDAHGPEDARVGRRAAGDLQDSARDAARDPGVVRSAGVRGHPARGPVGGEVPVAGDLGDQQAATVGQVCIRPGEARTPTAPATSCCSTPARRSCSRRPAC